MLRLIAIAMVCTMLLIPIAGYTSNIITNGPLLIAVSCGLSYVVMPVILLRLWPAQKVKRSKSMQDALHDGDLLTVEHEVRDVVQIEEIEDEGLHFLISIETGDTLSLSGQYLYGPVERNEFPSRRVQLFINKTTGLLYGIAPIGERIPTWPVYVSFADGDPKLGLMLADGTLSSQPIAEIITRFRLQLATQTTSHDGAIR